MIVSDICTRALGLAGVTGTGSAASAEEMQIAVNAYNLMLFSWALDGLDVGHNDTSVSSDTVYIDQAYLKCVQYALAVELAAEFSTDLSPNVAAIALMEMDKVRAALADINLLGCDEAVARRWPMFNHVTGQ